MKNMNVVLMRSGRNVECALNVTPKQAAQWKAAKLNEWRQHSPGCIVKFDMQVVEKTEPYVDWVKR